MRCNHELRFESAVRSKLLTHSELCDADPVAQGDCGGFGQGAPGLEAAGSRVGVAVAHSLHQRRKQPRLAAQPRPRPWTEGKPVSTIKRFIVTRSIDGGCWDARRRSERAWMCLPSHSANASSNSA